MRTSNPLGPTADRIWQDTARSPEERDDTLIRAAMLREKLAQVAAREARP